MNQKTFYLVVGSIFSLIALLHLLRLLRGWEAVIGGWSVPMWFSGVALAVAAILAYSFFKNKNR